jgi:SAM-dependent methyltransferase
MNALLRGMVQATVESFDLPGPVLEVGSYQVEGLERLIDLRGLFQGVDYTGLDLRPGPGVDMVGDVEALPQADGSVGTVLALNLFEHVRCFWRGLEEVHRVLRPDGALLVCAPFHLHLHNHPNDYWRFSPQALEWLLERYPSKIVGWHGPAKRPIHTWALAFRECRPPITAAQHQFYQGRLRRHVKMPLPWRRWLGYRLGRLLLGGAPFAPYLEREKWHSTCLSPLSPAGRPARPGLALAGRP